MANMTAAQAARQAAALDKPFFTGDLNTTFRQAISDGTIAYGRIREWASGKRSYGVILAADVADSAERAPFYDAPKYVVDACPAIIYV